VKTFLSLQVYTDYPSSTILTMENVVKIFSNSLFCYKIYIDVCLSIWKLNSNICVGFDQNVIPISKQLQYFGEYKKRLESANGKQRTEDHINKAIFIISAGTNDFVVNYFSLPIRRQRFTVPAYHQFLLQHLQDFIQVWLSPAATVIYIINYY